ncbi:MAG: heavy metal-associated domain-containing protein [Hydrotalea sp.]|nr:heavy metal-associated domain-containing protein [Hydrotalea sp.]
MDNKQTFAIDGMHCAACVEKITTAMGGESGAQVSLTPPRLTISGATPLAILQQKIKNAGARYGLRPRTAAEVRTDSMPASTMGQDHNHAALAGNVTGNGVGGEDNRTWLQTYYPLLLIVAAISIVSLKNIGGMVGGDGWRQAIINWMVNFEAGFFLVFGLFKLLDIKGFATAYATYDLLAGKWLAYGFIYPFLELALGFMFLFHYQLTIAFYAAILLMGFSSLGVIRALMKKQQIRCACLGTALNLPMTSITLVEDLAMVAMAAIMLAIGAV